MIATRNLETDPVDSELRAIHRTRVRLILEGRPENQREFQYERALIRIGADPDNDLVLADQFVSAHHAELEHLEDGFLLRDLQSKNGTWLDGHRVREAFVSPGTVLTVGRTAVRVETDGTYEVPLGPPGTSEIVGQTLIMRECLAQLERFARSDETVVLQGETGVGKD